MKTSRQRRYERMAAHARYQARLCLPGCEIGTSFISISGGVGVAFYLPGCGHGVFVLGESLFGQSCGPRISVALEHEAALHRYLESVAAAPEAP